jgi:hypothetical protein
MFTETSIELATKYDMYRYGEQGIKNLLAQRQRETFDGDSDIKIKRQKLGGKKYLGKFVYVFTYTMNGVKYYV